MKRSNDTIWTAKFIGRKIGAIGVRYPIVARARGQNEEEARLSLYDTYEHISNLTLTRDVDDDQDQSETTA